MEHTSEKVAIFKHRISRACIRVAVALYFALGSAAFGADEVWPGTLRSALESEPQELMAEGRLRYPYPPLGELEAKVLQNYEVRVKKLEAEEARLKASLFCQGSLNFFTISARIDFSRRSTCTPLGQFTVQVSQSRHV